GPDHAKEPSGNQKGPRRSYHGELDENQPQPARPKKTAQRLWRSATAVKESSRTSQKEKQRRAEVRNPAREKQSVISSGNVLRLKAKNGKEVAGVVKRHDDHHQPTHNVERNYTAQGHVRRSWGISR